MRDWVLIDWDSDGDLENGYISGIRRSDQHRTAEICSYHDESGMETLACKSTAPDAYKQGVTTGVKSGQINKILEDDGLGFACAHSTKAFRARIDGAKGDSGGPVFTECPNDYLKLELCGMANVVQATVGDTACNGNTIYFNTKGFPTWELVQKDSINPVTA